MNAARAGAVSESMAEQTGELAVVIFTNEGKAGWQPDQVFTRRWIKFADDSEGWSYTLYDGSWCARDEQLHLYQAGGGPPYVEGPATLDGQLYMHRIWIAPGESVSSNTAARSDEGPLAARRAPDLSEEELLAIGYRRVDEHPGDIFSRASDEPTTWCEECKDNIPRYENPCEHLATCWHCQTSFTAENSESRCPDCNESQLECKQCEEPGAETCSACTRPICKECLCECGHPLRNQRSPETTRGKRRPPKSIDRMHARLRAAVEIRETTLFWGQVHTITPRLCSKVFGDGRALLALSAINSRPNYYVIRIDSTWNVEDRGAPNDAPDLRDYLDDIYQALEDDFGSTAYADDEDVIADGRSGDYLDWPVFDGDGGTSWRRMAWPEWKGVMFTVHPFSWHNLLVPASPKRAAQREAKRRRVRRKKRRGWA